MMRCRVNDLPISKEGDIRPTSHHYELPLYRRKGFNFKDMKFILI